MIRKMLVVAAAVAMPVSVIAATAGPAGAVTKVDASADHVTCTTGSATAKFAPALHLTAGAPSNQVTKLKGTLGGCTVTGPNAVTVTSATISGTITSTASTHSCTGLTGSTIQSGNLTVKWKTVQKLVSSTTVLAAAATTGALGGDNHGTFALSFGGATGSFSGNVGTDGTDNETSVDETSLLASCASGPGLKGITVVPNTNTGAGASFHIG